MRVSGGQGGRAFQQVRLTGAPGGNGGVREEAGDAESVLTSVVVVVVSPSVVTQVANLEGL